MDTYLPYVGFVQFPQRPDDLTVAVCPACFEPRAAGRCPRCGLDLANPAIAEIDRASTDATAALDRRLEARWAHGAGEVVWAAGKLHEAHVGQVGVHRRSG